MSFSDEQEKMISLLLKYKRDPEEYRLMEEYDPPRDGDTGPVLGRIAVMNEKTGATEIYKAGPFSCWTGEFERDLQEKRI